LNLEKNTAYIYQNDSLIIPPDTPDSRIEEEVSLELFHASFGGVLDESDSFTIPSIDGPGNICCVTVPEGELPLGWKAVPLRQAVNTITGGTMADGIGPLGHILRT